MSRNGKTCSWCHRMNWDTDFSWPTCPSCGHRADVSMTECDCAQCNPPRSLSPADTRAMFAARDRAADWEAAQRILDDMHGARAVERAARREGGAS